MQTILEGPLYVGILGGVLTLALLWAAMQSGTRALWTAAGVVGLLTAVLVAIGVGVETDREQLARWMDRTAAELEANQIDRVASKIHPAANSYVHSLPQRARNVRFKYADIKSIHGIDFTGREPNLKATARFNVLVELEYSGHIRKIPRYIELELYRVDGKWLVYDVRDEEFDYAFRRRAEAVE